MNSRKKIINELRFQLDSKEVKDQHYPVQLSASDANAILTLLEEREAVKPKEVNMYPTGQYACGFCGHISVGSKDYHAKYCPECGKAVKWDEA